MKAVRHARPQAVCQRHSLIALMVGMGLSGGELRAETALDMSFIQGGSAISQAAWVALNSNYIPGRYLVDLSLNGRYLGKQVLDITPADSETLCLPDAWLQQAGVRINPDYFQAGHDAARRCHVLSAAPSVQVDFDVSTQTLSLSLPQRGLLARPQDVEWDYGSSALRVNYNLNASHGRNNNIAFGSADVKANVGSWVVSTNAAASSGDSGNNASVAMFTASRAIRALNADLLLGKTQVGDGLLGSTGTYGVALSRNNSMRPGNLGYTPVFSGIAKGSARVSLSQGNRLLYSEIVPPGPFAISDVPLYSSGDVTMTVTEDSGQIQTQVFPLSVIAGQLSPGQHEFNVAAGIADDQSDLDGPLMSAAYGYGFERLTLRAGGVLHARYHGVNGGVVSGLGSLGAFSVEGAYASRRYQRRPVESGSKVQLAWSKQLESSGIGLRLSWSRALSEWFPDLSGFDPLAEGDNEARQRRVRDEWSAGVSQGVGRFSLAFSGWQRSYYRQRETDIGLNGTLSTQINGVSLSLAASQSMNSQRTRSWSSAFSVSVPFTLFDQRYSSNTTFSTGAGGGVGFSSGVSGNVNERLSWGVSAGRERDGGASAYLNGNYSGDRATLGGTLSQSASGGSSGSLSLSGALLALPAAHSVMLSRTTSDTVAVIGVKDTPGVRVTASDGKTDRRGNLVVALSSYDLNTVTIDAGTLPLDTELGNTSQQVVPTAQAVVWLPFEPIRVHRYLLQVRQPDGQFVAGGTWARDGNGTPLGFVAAHGVLMLSVMAPPGNLTLGECHIPADRLQETDKLQEIRCEQK